MLVGGWNVSQTGRRRPARLLLVGGRGGLAATVVVAALLGARCLCGVAFGFGSCVGSAWIGSGGIQTFRFG